MPVAPPLTFRGIFAETAPAAGELWIQAAEEHGDCRALSMLVLDFGIGALRQSGATIECIVIQQDPTLDDLLAAHFCQRLLRNEKLGDGYRHIARYAALVREGLRPSESIPVEDSLEGVFLFLRTEAEHAKTPAELSDPTAARRFLAAWDRIAQRIDIATADPKFDPFVRSPLTGDPEFGRVRPFLEKDRCNYRDDVRRGQAYRAQVPEVAECAALLLREPRSLLFRYWYRDDSEAPCGGGYRVLMVDWGRGNWVISTDPRKRISLQVLSQRLQAIEPPNDQGQPGQWFDGQPFHHTLIAAPRGGTRLSEKQIVKAVRGWASLRPAKPKPPPEPGAQSADGWRKYIAMFLVPIIGAAANFVVFKWGGISPKGGQAPAAITNASTTVEPDPKAGR
jgi:hypothetical protein